jgi:hypothetical protein
LPRTPAAPLSGDFDKLRGVKAFFRSAKQFAESMRYIFVYDST